MIPDSREKAPSHQLELIEDAEIIKEIIQQIMNESDKKASDFIRLKYEGRGNAEIAAILSTSEVNVRQMYRRFRMAVQSLLANR